MAADERGNTVAVWVGSQGPETAVRVALGDAVAPSMRFVQLRRITSRGREATAKLTVDDDGVWGPLSVRWRFTDRRSGSGAAPVYAAGPVRRSCLARDAVGNPRATRPILVTPGCGAAQRSPES